MSPFDLVKAASGGDDLNPKCKGAALASGDAIPGIKKTSFVVLYGTWYQMTCVPNGCTDTQIDGRAEG